MAFGYTSILTENLDVNTLVMRGYDVTGTNLGVVLNLYIEQTINRKVFRILDKEIFCLGVAVTEIPGTFTTIGSAEDLGEKLTRTTHVMELTGANKGVIINQRTTLQGLNDARERIDTIVAVDLEFVPTSQLSGGEIIST